MYQPVDPNAPRFVGDTTQVPGAGRVVWQAEVRHNKIQNVELKSNQVVARVAFNPQGQINSIEVSRGLTTPVHIGFDEAGKLKAYQGGEMTNNQTARDAMTVCHQLFKHEAVHRKLAEAMVAEGQA